MGMPMTKTAEKIDAGALYQGLVAKRDQRRVKDMRDGANVDELQRVILLKERLFCLSLESFELAETEEEPAKRGALMSQGLSSAAAYVKMLDVYEKRRAKHGEEKQDG